MAIDQIYYSIGLILINLTSLNAIVKIQKNILTKVRPVGLYNLNKKEEQNALPLILCKWSIYHPV